MGSSIKIQIVGYKNSGKTTLIADLLQAAAADGLRAGTLKHHGHGGRIAFQDENSDTGIHRSSGAIVSGVQGEDTFQLCLDQPVSFSGLVRLYEPLELDLLLIEGFKEEQLPRVVLLKHDEDVQLLQSSTHVLLVIIWPSVSAELIPRVYPVYRLNEKEQYIDFLKDWMKGMST
ncbi:molybdopterin-guanine dinucleotide biosynthesis protein B [Fictibacillus enclensis]|uniref:molybdopterin-guanine dinucleotide biosynthesis protein B n=1 Tax=Fictibacillus enclensis TaxID=1017270 RepID=UPI0024C07681|nr:molybdopterin-guanine dinucleotide biosynthesis protein B [Fictibacillus enclensis]MDM5337795.1 molybdopterin-guanine dinucleotide biosynthesis protein B [Fictibacillus enclensis]WHY74158.1 molybdopterin-guanine dinucleotide biosynthesis protein B [Fictibacillus enclensis]